MLCSSLADLRRVQDEDASPLFTALGEATAAGSGNALDVLRQSPGSDQLLAIGTVVVTHAGALSQVVFPAAPDLVVALQHAYEGYGAGVAALKQLADNPNAGIGETLGPLQQLTDGRTALGTAIDLADTARAAGTLSCS